MLVNERLSAPCYRPQTLASNLAKSQKTDGVLAHAAARGLQDLPGALAKLRATNFRMTDAMMQRLLTRDAERKKQP